MGEIGPVNKIEQIACIGSLLLALIVNANLFGQMAMLISTINKRATARQVRLDSANSVMENIKLEF